MNTAGRITVAALSLSAATFAGLIVKEHYTEDAVIPVRGDVPTVGFGMTQRPDGSPVQLGDRTDPVEAVQRSLAHIQQDERGIKRCVTAPLHQREYDLMVDFSYQYGVAALCNSSMVKLVNSHHYLGACEAYLAYRFIGKGENRYDCSTVIDGNRNRRCWGVWVRQQERHKSCMEVQ